MTNEGRFLGIKDAIEWNLVTRGDATPNPTGKSLLDYAVRSFDSRLIAVGIGSTLIGQRWLKAGNITIQYPFSFSSVSEFQSFGAVVKTAPLLLNKMVLIPIDVGTPPFTATIRFHHWIVDARVEVWRYDGIEEDVYTRFDGLVDFLTSSGAQ